MRLRHPSGRLVHLSCGLSLDHGDGDHADDVTAAVARLDIANAALRAHCGTGVRTVSLRLPARLAARLADDGRARSWLRAEIDARGLEVLTLGGAPGQDTDEPDLDWSEPARLRHTLALARVLVDLLPFEEVRGALMTCGLGRAEEWDEAHQRAGARHLSRLSGGLADLAWRVGRAVRVGFEPGPGGVLDSPEQTVAALSRIDKDRLGLCLDLSAVVRDWAAPLAGIDRLTDAGLSVITARITDPSIAWQPVLRHLLAADTARTEYVDIDIPGTDEERGAALAYVLEELTALGLVAEQQPCTAP
ncbi:sugar phosphate isomerase/epimerase family protein [Actinoplanes utahensis]|uniref:Xylose isomerase n=1 Tax=Actinoplanes utahensis TaxID=1869 RepID=A0A0A6UIS8_ACTUT|nr:TIM barrel protein [Actinoplanes utahensis]KHD76005.1 hypothetical protein MB27_19140 [Actinoplanes utahensis]GIF35527.1 hypothetical protein Aut01nite_85130 [Actinoplanes utahensis]